ncbi:MAG TPA: glycosyltransferase family 39 protein, partial [Solirubrobacteraceae bacterium]|nr:glycosyltransferase family 39 protein [Solirubrobacteraceae bacterium]
MLRESSHRRTLARLGTSTRAPIIGLILVSLLSLGARSLLLDEPCQSPCTTANEHTMVFDEAYYVNAARVIAGIHPPQGDHYDNSPLGTDPNAEHPQGAKLIVAASIELFGDGPFAWRLGSLIFGTIAILGMFALVRSAGGGPWSALGAATLMAADNLLLVHGRIFTLDIYVVAMMIWGAAFYLQGRAVLAGVVLAVGFCFKLVGPYALGVLGLLELGRMFVRWRDPDSPPDWGLRKVVPRFAATVFTSAGVFVGLLALMGLIATPYADAEARLITGGPFAHISHMFSYAAQQVSPHGPQGIASYPWQWLVDLKPILYLRVAASLPGHEAGAIHPVTAVWGMPSPAIMALGIPALLFCLYRFLRRRPGQSPHDQQLAMLAVAWFLGTWVPFAVLSLIDQRTSYLYYMVIVMPGVYLAATYAAA